MPGNERSARPRRPLRERRIRRVWGFLALASAGAAAFSAADENGRQRLAALLRTDDATRIADGFASQDKIAGLAVEITRLRSETRLLALEKEAMSIKIAALEAEFGPLTGSIPDPAGTNVAFDAAKPVEGSEVDMALAAEPDATEMAPKPVRTIDVGFVPLPTAREGDTARDAGKNESAAAPGDARSVEKLPDATSNMSALASPVARVVASDVVQTRFAIQLAIVDTMDAARARWKALAKDQGLLVGGLDPFVAIAEEASGIRIRLLAGPFANAEDAIQVCSALLDRNIDCRAVRSEGQHLVMR